ncbi:MAG: pyridoxal phosphate-dependent aminotransferase [Thermoplasmata archaeon]
MKPFSNIINKEIKNPSPIREIMKMAEPKNIINMGLDPKDVISFGGGWVDHYAPDELIESYIEIVSSKNLFHLSGGYSPTSGFEETKEAVKKFEKTLFNQKLNSENIIIGGSSSQLTIDLFRVLLNDNDKILLPDPTYANYFGQLSFVSSKLIIENLKFLNKDTWKYLENKKELLDIITEKFKEENVKALLLVSPDNPTSQILPDDFVDNLLKAADDTGTYVIFDFAYKTQYFSDTYPRYFSYSPIEHPSMITINSNSKWGRGLGRRMGWVEANQDVINAMERMQQVSILCPDTLHQMAFSKFVEKMGSKLLDYVNKVRMEYKKSADITVRSIEDYLGFRYLKPMGGLYVVADVGMDSDKFVIDVLKNTGVIFVPGKGFGSSLTNGIRISYGPLVRNNEKILEGIERVGKYIRSSKNRN